MLEKFVMQRLRAFSADRSKTDTRSTSRLSPHVHYGEISIRHIYYVVRHAPSALDNCPKYLCQPALCCVALCGVACVASAWMVLRVLRSVRCVPCVACVHSCCVA